MKNTLVVIADLGGFKAFQLDDNRLHSTPRLELIEEFVNQGVHSRLVDKVTDLSGRFPRGSTRAVPSGAMSDGERHNINLEWRKRLVRRLAEKLNSVLHKPDAARCYLAASLEISRQLLDELDAKARLKIEKSIIADLTKVEKSALLRHFGSINNGGTPRPQTFA